MVALWGRRMLYAQPGCPRALGPQELSRMPSSCAPPSLPLSGPGDVGLAYGSWWPAAHSYWGMLNGWILTPAEPVWGPRYGGHGFPLPSLSLSLHNTFLVHHFC